jgi:hypothetical protein
MAVPGAASAQTNASRPGTLNAGSVVIEATGAYTGALVNGLEVVATCDASAEGAVSAIVIDKCWLTNKSTNHPSTAPGTTTTSNFVESESTLNFQLCWHAYAIPLLDPLNVATTSGCATGILPTGGGIGSSTSQNF